jgi:hypothetical protein
VSRLHSKCLTDDVGVAAICFGPGFLEERDPDLVFVGLAEDRFSCLADWHELVDDDFFDDSVDAQSYLVDSIGTSGLFPENANDS